jgi:hypothetical protein
MDRSDLVEPFGVRTAGHDERRWPADPCPNGIDPAGTALSSFDRLKREFNRGLSLSIMD